MNELDFEKDAADTAAEPASLERVMELANLMVEREKEVSRLEQELKEAKAALAAVQTEDLPRMMEEIGMKLVMLADGSKVEVVDDVHCGITEARRDAAHKWLVDNGFGGLIKTQVIVSFDRGELDAACAYTEELNRMDPEHPAAMKDAVHPATLKSFVKEQLAAGAEIPQDLFGIHPFSRAKYQPAR